MGDPAGIGPEICLRLLSDESIQRECVPIIFGDAEVLKRAATHCSLPFPDKVHTDLAAFQTPGILDLKAIDNSDVEPGTVSAKTGHAAYTYLTAAIDAAQK